MFETLKRLYLAGRIDNAGILNAVGKTWITPEQGERIMEITGGAEAS